MNIMEDDFELNRIKLNTVELERWLYPNWKIEDFCDKKISWEDLDNNSDFFSADRKKEAFWENYKDYNTIKIIDADWTEKEVKIPTIINWWMGTGVSSPKLVEAMNKIWFWWHLSSIDIGFYYYYENNPELFNDNFTWKVSQVDGEQKEQKDWLKEQVKRDFDDIFKWELGLNDEFINKHFFECKELWKSEKNKWFNWELWKQSIARMMDLVALYKNVTELKQNWNNVWINCMYKTSSYIASLKISILTWMDYVTTAAWNPLVNPKVFLKDFCDELIEQGRKVSLPAFWLLVSSNKVISDYDYDYYVFEEWAKAGGHIIRLWNEDKFCEWEKIKTRFTKNWKPIPPFYVAGWVSTNKEIKETMNAWFDWVQIWTLAAVSEEACDWDWEQFKKRLIWWNHLWENSEVDEEYFKEIEKAKNNIEWVIKEFNGKIVSYLSKENNTEYSEETPEIARIMNYLYKIVYNDFFTEEIKDFESLSEEQQKLYTQLKTFLFESNNGDMKKIYKVLRNNGNAKKFIKEFNAYVEKNGLNPNMLVFDSTVWFPWRMKITENIFEIIAWEVKSTWCINCLTDCILAGRWDVRENRGSTFCIENRLNYLNPERNIAFSWRSTIPYAEIRPIRDIMAYLMWYYVER